MRAVWQRVKNASVEVNGRTISSIGRGALVLLGVEAGDAEGDAEYMAEKCATLRVFDDEKGRLNLSVSDVGGEILVVSQFTLCADCRKGRRPSFVSAAPPDVAVSLYELVVEKLKGRGIKVETGQFQAAMQVHLINDGPVTILLDSRKRL